MHVASIGCDEPTERVSGRSGFRAAPALTIGADSKHAAIVSGHRDQVSQAPAAIASLWARAAAKPRHVHHARN